MKNVLTSLLFLLFTQAAFGALVPASLLPLNPHKSVGPFSNKNLMMSIAPQWTNVEVLISRVDGDYDDVCADGTREVITSLDLTLGNVCPKQTTGTNLNLISAQRRSDGQFDVVCADQRKIVASEEDLILHQACPTSFSPIILSNGTYRVVEGNKDFYDETIQGIVENKQMKQLKITATSGWYGTLDCVGIRCKGQGTDSTDVVVEVLSSTRYHIYNRGVDAVFAPKLP